MKIANINFARKTCVLISPLLKKARFTAFDRKFGILAYKLSNEAFFSLVVFFPGKKIQASQNNKKIVDVTKMDVWHIFQMGITLKQTWIMGIIFWCIFFICKGTFDKVCPSK